MERLFTSDWLKTVVRVLNQSQSVISQKPTVPSKKEFDVCLVLLTIQFNFNCFLKVAFFNADKNFIKSKEHGSGNTALHMACRHGHFVSIVSSKVGEIWTDNNSNYNNNFISVSINIAVTH